jgi:hypothetical protein
VGGKKTGRRHEAGTKETRRKSGENSWQPIAGAAAGEDEKKQGDCLFFSKKLFKFIAP